MANSTRFHLFVAGAKCVLEVPDGISALVAPEGELPAIHPHADEADACLVLEPVMSGHQPHLVVINRGRLVINGHTAPAVGVVVEQDHLQLNEDYALHVAIFHQPDMGPSRPEEYGKTCPVCLTPIDASTSRVYRCWSCGVALHAEGEEKPIDDRLECVLVSPSCPACGAPVRMTQGYAHRPEVNGD
jgi:hypothetical protein